MGVTRARVEISAPRVDERRQRLLAECASLRRTAILGVSISIAAAVVCVLTVPLVYDYLQEVQSTLEAESNYCRTRTTTLWREVTRTSLRAGSGLPPQQPLRTLSQLEGEQATTTTPTAEREEIDAEHGAPRRLARQAGNATDDETASTPSEASESHTYGTPPTPPTNEAAGAASQDATVTSVPVVIGVPTTERPGESTTQESAQSVTPASTGPASAETSRPPPPPHEECGCAYGPPGPKGPDGHDGKDGVDGTPGTNGLPGENAISAGNDTKKEWCFECEPGIVGPAGLPGPKGAAGAPGRNGTDSDGGLRGEAGDAGPPGPAGKPGLPGPKGVAGAPGNKTVEQVSAAGPAGSPGPKGIPGAKGAAGKPGTAGTPGSQGPPGDPGTQGRDGKPGAPGEQGMQGDRGSPGKCDCPPPRTAPGY